MQYLIFKHALSTNGKMAIIQNGSPLAAGDAGSGPAEIRRYILGNDWLDCIVQLSPDQFMNAEIATCIWVVLKNKPVWRAGKVQLIDASSCYVQRRKAIGQKKNDITDECRELIITAYGEYSNKAYQSVSGLECESKVMDLVEFGYRKITVEQPEIDSVGNIIRKKGKLIPDKKKRSVEIVPLSANLDDYLREEIQSRTPNAWIDEAKTQIGYEIVFGKIFYKPALFRNAQDLLDDISSLDQKETELNKEILAGMSGLRSFTKRSDSQYIATDIEWFPRIPSTWEVVKGKYVLELLKRPVNADDGVITCFRDGEVTLRSKHREEGFTFADKEIDIKVLNLVIL